MNVISFCLYGTSQHYRTGAIKNAKLCKKVYPGWEVRFYVAPSIPQAVIDALVAEGAYIFIVEAPETAFFMNYRYLPCGDEDVDFAIFRDTDSRVDDRESAAVSAWIESGKGLHIMRDHPWHLPHPEQHMMLGGMWGVDCSKLRDFTTLANQCAHDTVHGADQRLLTKYVYPRFAKADDICVHDEFFDKKPFPECREIVKINGEYLPLFVGCQFDENDMPMHVEHLRMLNAHIKQTGQ
jgi:hypothetical protein